MHKTIENNKKKGGKMSYGVLIIISDNLDGEWKLHYLKFNVLRGTL